MCTENRWETKKNVELPDTNSNLVELKFQLKTANSDNGDFHDSRK